jgi:GntR family transcriptional regulator/MocR family aminotransferase
MPDERDNFMLTYNFENIECSLYEYLYKCIKNDINNGTLKANEQLPSKRSFAKHLGISTITVENAYDQLISEGYVYAVTKKGYYVADISDIPKTSQINTTVDIQLPVKSTEYFIDLSNNQTNPKNFPFSVWARLMREVISEKNEALMINSPCNGIYMLREAIAAHLHSFRGMLVDPNQIVIGAGTEYLYSMLIQLLGREKKYCVENPGHRKIEQIYKSNEVNCSFADMDEQGIAVNGLYESKADIAHISPTHHFPTGITMPVSRRYELLAWANEKNGRYIIEDDYDSEFRLNGKPIPSLQSIDVGEKVIYMNTFSKSLASTIRISYMILPIHLANRFYEKLSFYSCTVSNFEQYTLAQFIKMGYFEKHINRMRLFYARQRKAVLECIQKSPVNDFCEIIERDSGLHLLLRLKTEWSNGELCRHLMNHGIHIIPLSKYFHDSDKSVNHTFILNYSNLDVDKLGKALEYIEECF